MPEGAQDLNLDQTPLRESAPQTGVAQQPLAENNTQYAHYGEQASQDHMRIQEVDSNDVQQPSHYAAQNSSSAQANNSQLTGGV